MKYKSKIFMVLGVSIVVGLFLGIMICHINKDEKYYDGKNEVWFRNDELVSYEEKEDSESFVFLCPCCPGA